LKKNARLQLAFQMMNEIGIIQQLSVTELNRRLPDSVHFSHFTVINHLSRLGDGRTPRRIADALQVTKATMTNTLTRLTGLGFIEVRDNPGDGRSKLVYLTAKGEDFRNRALASLQPLLEQMDKALDLERITTILPQLQELREYLDNNRDAPAD
jgi:DNA-binding MarR family transcriptional regulator